MIMQDNERANVQAHPIVLTPHPCLRLRSCKQCRPCLTMCMGPGQVQRATVARRKREASMMSLDAQARALRARGQTLVEVSGPMQSRRARL